LIEFKMTLTLLLDLDDTLLETNIENFIPAYFQALSNYLNEYVKPEIMLPALMAGTKSMLVSEDPSRTLQDVFEADFYPKLGIPKVQLLEQIDYFYDNIFPGLESLTKRREGAMELVNAAFAKGYRVVVATDPLFPRKATYHRIRWAGLDPDRFAMISSFETFHFTKSHPAYYAEVLGRLGWPDGPVLMVGNDVERDLVPAQKLGIKAYHINGTITSSNNNDEIREGNLFNLKTWLDSTDLDKLEPNFKSREAFLAILASTPAVLQSLTLSLSSKAWSHEPTLDDWSMIELICHLRDTEREVHHLQIKTLLEESKPFVPRPDAAVWAKQRKYLNEDGQKALGEFTSARKETLEILRHLSDESWSRPARHAIFGPTNFLEVVGFMGDHDKMHIQQAWNTLKSL
jgi:FMN phosphatase YigB (HAD superfamily)